MRPDKETAISLRKQGKSYREISAILKVPKSTLSAWMQHRRWSEEIKAHLTEKTLGRHTARIVALGKLRAERLEAAYAQAKREAADEFESLRHNPLFIAGLMLYWGEGDKRTKHQLRLVNSDPSLVTVFVCFLRQICGNEEHWIKAYLTLYADLDDKECKNFWSAVTGIPMHRFTKSAVITGRSKNRRAEHGMCTVLISSSYLKAKLLEWIRLMAEELKKDE